MSGARLTTTGRGLLAGGVTAALCGAALGERDLIRIAAMAGLLALLCWAWVALCGRSVGVERRLGRDTVPVGATAPVELVLTDAGTPLPGSALLLSDERPHVLGPPEQVRLPRRVGARASYDVPGAVRGVFDLGPIRVRSVDPLGLAEALSQCTATGRLVVTPRLVELPAVHLTQVSSGEGDNRPRALAVGNPTDVTVRDYRTGDDLRRVHWPSTARTGEIMVRREEQPARARATVLLDDRATAHRGSGSDSTLELAITAAGSLAQHLETAGVRVRFATTTGRELGRDWREDHGSSASALLEQLAELTWSQRAALSEDWVAEVTTESLVFGVFGVLHEQDVALLQRLDARRRARRGSSYAVCVDPRPRSDRGSDRPATDALIGLGWHTCEIRDTDDLVRGWSSWGR